MIIIPARDSLGHIERVRLTQFIKPFSAQGIVGSRPMMILEHSFKKKHVKEKANVSACSGKGLWQPK
jgi:hypothetical protein